MKNFRHAHGALCLETIEAKPIFEGDSIVDLQAEEKNRAKDIIEDFMIAANGVTVRYLSSRKIPSIRRVVRTPRRWERKQCLKLGGSCRNTLAEDDLQLANNHSLGGNAFKSPGQCPGEQLT
jgi:exoribonuclease R